MRKILSLTLAVVFSSAIALAQSRTGSALQSNPDISQIILSKNSEVPAFIKFRAGAEPAFSKFESWSRSNFGLSAKSGFKLLSSEKDKIGFTHYRYQQTFNDIPLEGTMFIVHVKNGTIVSMNGMIFDQLSLPSQSAMSEKNALSRALQYMNADRYRWQSDASLYPKGELIYACNGGDYAKNNYVLTYRFDIYSSSPLRREYVFVNVSSGKIVLTQDRIESVNVSGTAVTKYSGTQTIDVDSTGPGNYRLRETVRGMGIRTYDALDDSIYNTFADLTDSDNYWNNINANHDEVGTDAHWAAEVTYDYYFNTYNRNSVNNAGAIIRSFVHFGVNLSTAFWDGANMQYGDGDSTAGTTPYTALDIGGHEISHGVTQYTSNLTNQNEPGALSEGFSDCMATAIEYYGKPSTANWTIGEDVGDTMRSLSDPKAYLQPNTYLGQYWYTGAVDNGGVHTNGGVLNYWFYLVANGGTGTNDNSDAYTVTGTSLDTAAAILYRANTVYFTPGTNYAAARTFTIAAAIDLYGACSNVVQTVTDAWHAVGVGNAYIPGVQAAFTAPTTSFCSANSAVTFINNSNNGSTYTWDFGDGGTSTAINAVHLYATYGTFTVTLIADGGTCGSDTAVQTSYITLDSLTPCGILPATGAAPTQTACTGSLFDSGGPTANYQNNTNSTITIAPTGAQYITLDFSAFAFGNGDFLSIYDGPTTASPLIGNYTGGILPNGGTVTSTASSVTLMQTTNGNGTAYGFDMTWTCTPVTSAPVTDFVANDTSSCTGNIQFTDLSTNAPNTWAWTFGDGGTSTLQNPAHTYSANGTYTVSLTATNVIGNNTATKTGYITVALPSAPSASSPVNACAGGSALLSAFGNGILNWYDAPTGGNFIGSGSPINSPTVTLPTTFYVESNVSGSPQYAGKPDTSGGGGNSFGGFALGLLFDAYTPFTILTVDLYATGAGNRTIELQDSAGNTLQTVTLNLPDGLSTDTLNFPVLAGNAQQLVVTGQANLFRNTAGVNFPYTLANVCSVTGPTAFGTPGRYYFFYNWKVQGTGCISTRTPVQVNILPSPNANFSAAGGSGGNVTFTDISTGSPTQWVWSFGDGGISTVQNPTHTYGATGTYNVTLVVSNGTCSDTIMQQLSVTVGIGEILPADLVNVYPNPAGNELFIDWKGMDHRNTTITFRNVLGEIVTEFTAASSSISKLNMTALSAGVYTMEIRNEHGTLITKVVKQ